MSEYIYDYHCLCVRQLFLGYDHITDAANGYLEAKHVHWEEIRNSCFVSSRTIVSRNFPIPQMKTHA